jgi:hypothetical protein
MVMRALITAVFAFAIPVSNAARADAIDGNWCSPDGKFLSIEGPRIVTSGGTTTQGNYDRHHFHYVIPASDPGAGQQVFMTLRGELLVDSVRLGVAMASLAVEGWGAAPARLNRGAIVKRVGIAVRSQRSRLS